MVPAIKSATVSQRALNMAQSVSPIGLIIAGINKDNFDKVKDLCLKLIDDMEKGKFSDDDIYQAKKAICFAHEMIFDSVDSICNLLEGEPIHNQPDEQLIISAIKEVTKEDIMNYAKRIKIVTSYLLAEGKNAKERN